METEMETKKWIHCNTIKTVDLFNMNGKHLINVCGDCGKLQHKI